MAWSILQEKYCAIDAEENYPKLDQAFSDCKLVGMQKDPELWFNDLYHLNMRLTRIHLKYPKEELQVKSHMMTAMSNDHERIIIKFRGDVNDTTLVMLHKEAVLPYKSLIKTVGGKTISESVLTAKSKTSWKKFKGTCRKCGKIGHSQGTRMPIQQGRINGGSHEELWYVGRRQVSCDMLQLPAEGSLCKQVHIP